MFTGALDNSESLQMIDGVDKALSLAFLSWVIFDSLCYVREEVKNALSISE